MATENKQNPYIMPASIIIAAIIIGLGIYFGFSGANGGNAGTLAQGTTGQQQAPAQVDIKDVKTNDSPFIGDPNAPVTMAYWSDYQCPFCLRFEEDSMPQIVKNYVKTGKVKLVFMDYQFLGPDSDSTALIARAVWDVAPKQFYTWFRDMYTHQDGENTGWGSRSDVLAATKEVLGAEKEAKIAELSTKNAAKYKKAIAADRTEGSKFGINGTPGMIIGKQLVVGAQPYATVKAALDTAYKAATT